MFYGAILHTFDVFKMVNRYGKYTLKFILKIFVSIIYLNCFYALFTEYTGNTEIALLFYRVLVLWLSEALKALLFLPSAK